MFWMYIGRIYLLINKEKESTSGEHQGDDRNVIKPPGEHLGGDERCEGGDERSRTSATTSSTTPELSQGGDERSRTSPTIRSATDLHLAGIQFSLNKTESLEDISFERGTLELPRRIVVDDERHHIGTGNQEVTSYIYLMDCIIDTEKDVELLKSREIVENYLGSDEDVAKLFNSLVIGTTLHLDSKLNEVLDNVNVHYYKPWIACRKNVSRTVESFRNRWAFLSLLAAVCLFALAITQTVYAILAYYKNDSPPTTPAVPPPPLSVISRGLNFRSSPIGSRSVL